MSWVLAFVGFALLIVLHEAGHFAAAKAVGMRVERFALFFPPLLWKVRRGETEYAIGAVPLGGYVRITGMNPHEEIPPEHAHRAYFRQPVWKRIVVIAAGPAVNLLLAFLIIVALFMTHGIATDDVKVGEVERGSPAATVLRPGDAVVAVDGKRDPEAFVRQIGSHRCEGGGTLAGCASITPAALTIVRDGREQVVRASPRYDPETGRMRLGLLFEPVRETLGPLQAAGDSAAAMWRVTELTLDRMVALVYDEEARREVSGVVGSYEATRQSFDSDTVRAIEILALISLSLAIINLFPFLPLDGGHIFWALAEKVRGRSIPFAVMERASVFGFILVIALFAIGLSNDIGRLRGEGFGVQ